MTIIHTNIEGMSQIRLESETHRIENGYLEVIVGTKRMQIPLHMIEYIESDGYSNDNNMYE